MKYLFLSLLFISCSPMPEPSKEKESKYVEAFLRTKNVYTLNKNIDRNNTASLAFHVEFVDQLIELNFSTTKMSSNIFTLANTEPNPSSIKTSSDIHLGQLQIAIDNVDVTSCIVLECNSTKCSGQPQSISDFSGDIETKNMYINLTKAPTLTGCNMVSLGKGIHSITFKEVGSPVAGILKGARLEAQVIVYNRTFRPQNISNIYRD